MNIKITVQIGANARNGLLEILGRAITVETAELICCWLETLKTADNSHQFDPAGDLEKTIKLIRNNDTTAAAQQLREYLFKNPSCIYGRMIASAIALQDNQLENAIEHLNSVYLQQPNNTLALYSLGHCYERLGREAEAIEFYQDCLKFKNYLQLPRQRLAAIYFKNWQLEKTILEYEMLKNEYPDSISALVTLGYLYIAAGQYNKAISTFDTAILIYPDNFNAPDNETEQFVHEGRLYEAAQRLDDLLLEQPERADLILRHGDILLMLGDNDQALTQYQQAVKVWPDYLEATIKLGTHYLRMNEKHLAARQFNTATEINDQIVDAYIGLAAARKAAGKISDALSTLSLAAAIQPNSSLLFAETAILQFMQHQGENADSPPTPIENVIKAHRHQITLQPQNPDLYYRLGILMTTVSRASQAIEAFENALEINPLYTRAKSKLAICLFENGRQQAALDLLVEPDSLTKESLQLHYKTALLYCDKIKFASSLINLENYMRDNLTLSDPTVNISIILQNLSLLDRAEAMWDSLADTTSHTEQQS
ncbi:MAG: tetratricopeptide repeat protein [Planctomycetota bacterium]